MRLFIGIPFSERVRNRLRREVARIHPFIAKGKLSHWEGYHITLKFLGEVPEQEGAVLVLRMAAVRLETEPFELAFTELGTFKKRGGDVLWLGMTLPPELMELQLEVEALAVQAGFEAETRPYTPHLTLGRGVRYTESYEKTAKHWSLKNLEERVDRVVLFQSTQVEGKLAYVPLMTKRLGVTESAPEEEEGSRIMKMNEPEIVFSDTGPYTAVDVNEMEYLVGEKVPVRRVMQLCRCGESSRKPFCDGSHEKAQYSPQKKPARSRSRAKDYIGKAITIHFNLRVCSHAGVCFMKLPSVFDRSKKPWIDPDGATVQEIIDIIHRCPSGALSYSVAKDAVDCRKRSPKIVIIPGGPFNIQGSIRLRDGDGTRPYNPEHYCLCGCGKTRNSPFCDGSHLDPADRKFFMEE